MSGVLIVGTLLTTHAPLIALVDPATRIKADELPQGVALPALAVTSISVIDRQTLKVGALVRVRERVQVTIAAANVQSRLDIFGLVRSACRGKTGSFAGFSNVAVLTDGAGPDFRSPEGDIYMKTQDFIVSFDEPA